MSKMDMTGIYQLKSGTWVYCYGVVVDGKIVWKKFQRMMKETHLKQRHRQSRQGRPA